MDSKSIATPPRPLRIALIGYGKMGKAIDELATAGGHSINLKITSSNIDELTAEALGNCEVAIEFTGPSTAVQNIKTCIAAGTPVICGSTGWLDALPEIEAFCKEQNGAFLYASNFSIGVNIFFEVNKRLAALMQQQQQYDVTIEEIHHTGKKDAPSGTAISLANDIVRELPWKTGWQIDPAVVKENITITSKREDPAPGTHIVKYASEVDEIEIMHTAKSRQGFASGAIKAAEFLVGRKGVFSMKDVLGL